MTHEQLIQIAIRRGIVQWDPSHLVEQLSLRVGVDPKLERLGVVVMARALLGRTGGPGRWRPIYPRLKSGEAREFRCKELSRKQPVELGLMLERR